jgi:uncharacterized alpha-E superfamily protein
LISRVADHCFWLGRYLERAESTARVLVVTLNLALDAELTPRQCWLPVIVVSGEEAEFRRRYGDEALGDAEVAQRYMTWDEENGNSIRRAVGAARENARSVREVVSLEVWETVNELHLWLDSDDAQVMWREHRYGFYRHVRQAVQLVLGQLRGTMLHDTPLDFIWLGVLFERSGQTARILDVHHHALTRLGAHQVVETALWLSLLRACSGFEPFMKRNTGKVTGDAVAAFLVYEPRFPRSVRYCLQSAYKSFASLRPPEATDLPGGRSLERLRVLARWLDEQAAEPFDASGLHALLTHVVDETAAICAGIGVELLGYDPVAAPVPIGGQ